MENTNEVNKKNKVFLILSFFGIVFVVLGHLNNVNIGVNILFPYYSFHMALFAFISGYFFKDRKLIDFLKVKFRRLIIPYFIWNFIYGITITILKYLNIINYGENISIFNLFIAPFYGNGNHFIFNLSAWFVISIFFVQLIYLLITKICKKFNIKYFNVFLLIISIIIASIELKYLKKFSNINNLYLITRICFLFPFYIVGQIYKQYEKNDNKKNRLYFLLMIIIIQCILICNFNICYGLNTLEFYNNYIIYFIGSMMGILFYLIISKILSRYIKENTIIYNIGANTSLIMYHHLFIFFIINTFVFVLNKYMGFFDKFDLISYKDSCWYLYSREAVIIYLLLALYVPLKIKECFKKFTNKIWKIKE